MSKPIDYTEYFEYPTLDKIHGKPTYATLDNLKNQLKTNSQSITSDLGGGQYGHLGLVLTDVEYDVLAPNEPFVIPNHPGPFQIPIHILDPIDIAQLREDHKENLRIFRECKNVESSLRKQIVAAVKPIYLQQLRNTLTNAITETVSDILVHLFKRYGTVDSNKVDKEEAKIKALIWDVKDPPTYMFTAIEDFERLCAAANLMKSQEQVVALGIAIVRRTGKFTESLKFWHAGDEADKTWEGFKEFFEDAHQEYETVVDTTRMDETNFQQAHSLIEEVNANVDSLRDELITSISTLHETPTTSSQATPSTFAPSTTTETETMNATTAQINTEILTALQAIQTQMTSLSTTNNYRGNNRRVGTGSQHLTKYCWSHGRGGHTSAQCTRRLEGHQANATMNNRMGGTNRRCTNNNNSE